MKALFILLVVVSCKPVHQTKQAYYQARIKQNLFRYQTSGLHHYLTAAGRWCDSLKSIQ